MPDMSLSSQGRKSLFLVVATFVRKNSFYIINTSFAHLIYFQVPFCNKFDYVLIDIDKFEASECLKNLKEC